MKVLFFLPNLSGYWDRFLLLQKLSQQLEKMLVLVGHMDRKVDRDAHMRIYPNLELINAGFEAGARFWNARKASAMAESLIYEHSIQIAHDTFGNLLPLFKHRKHFPQLVCCTSFLTLQGWRLRHVWQDLPWWKWFVTKNAWKLWYDAWIEKRLCHFSDYVVLQAPGFWNLLSEYTTLPKTKLRVLPNNVDAEYWKPAAEKRDRGESKEIRLLFVGSLDQSRGLFVTIELIRKLLQQGIHASLTLIGSWGLFAKEKTLRMICEYGLQSHIHLRGRVKREEVLAAFRSHDLFLYQTINEGFPRIVLEALSTGIPILASDHPGILGLDLGQNFIQFTQFGDLEALSSLVKEYLENRDRFEFYSSVGREAVLQQFSTPSVAKQYLDLYQEFCSQETQKKQTQKKH
jgi:glycosyltransferase involved in cell wall biosynthesis